LSGGIAPDSASNQNILQSLGQYKRYQISASDVVLISGKDAIGKFVGMNFSLINQFGSISKTQSAQIIPTKNTSPNSDISHVGSSYSMHTESLPVNLNLQPDPAIQSSSFNLAIREMVSSSLTSSVGSQNEIGSTTVSTIASFQNIPITEYSNITVHTSNTATSTIFEMSVVDMYDDVFTSTSTYIVDTSVSPNAVLSSQGSQGSLLPTDLQNGTGGATGGGTNSSGIGNNSGNANSAVGGSIDIGYLISLIKVEIQNSGVRANFKQRYILKLNAIEKNYKSLIESKKRVARITARDTTASLALIVKDLSRSRALNYTGGMKKAEASFLYMQFTRISRAFGD
jgi:hypothetical protein